jgi:hypothetical protein
VPVTGYGYVASETGAAVNCRAAPSTDAAVITIVTHGEEIAVRGAPAEGWQGVVCGGTDGYVAAQFIATTPPTLPPAPTATPPPEPDVVEEDVDQPEQAPARPGSNPWFDGAPLGIAGAWADGGATSAWNAVDGSQASAWYSANGVGQAALTLDLGAVQQLTGVRWMYAETGGADSMRLLVSLDGSSWTQLITTSNRAPYTWEGLPVGMEARYVRLVFDNPNGVPVLGLLAEVEIWGVTTTADTLSPASRVAVGAGTTWRHGLRRRRVVSSRGSWSWVRMSPGTPDTAVHLSRSPVGTRHETPCLRTVWTIVRSVRPGRQCRV